jgi:signal transduction histidine kinase
MEIRCRFDTPQDIPDIPVNGKNRRSIFLLVKESLNNVAKHAHASEVIIRVDIAGSLHIRIEDNGVGMAAGSDSRGNGLGNMRRRVHNLRGSMRILNGKGTTLVFDIPVRNLTV